MMMNPIPLVGASNHKSRAIRTTCQASSESTTILENNNSIDNNHQQHLHKREQNVGKITNFGSFMH